MVRQRAEGIVEAWAGGRGTLIPLLQAIQAEVGYLPPGALARVAGKLAVPLSQVYSVVTFYRSFTMAPRGRHLVTCCTGTACHVRGAQTIADEICRVLDVADGGTSADGLFTFETVRCLGACALAPVVVVDGEYHGNMTARRVRRLLTRIQASEEAACDRSAASTT